MASELLVAEYLRHLADLENEHDKKMAKYLTVYQDFLAQKTILDETLVKHQTAMFEDAVTDQQRLSVASSVFFPFSPLSFICYIYSLRDFYPID